MVFVWLWVLKTAWLIAAMGAVGAVFLVLEWALPRSPVSFHALKRAVFCWAAYLPVAGAIGAVQALLMGRLAIQPIVHIPGSGIVAALVLLVVGEFFGYWSHRAQHAIPWLWRFHALHHSHTELSALTAINHWTEPLVRGLTITVPLTFIGVDAPETAFWTALALARGFFDHSACRLNFGPLRWVFVDNRFHRIHHSSEARHAGLNYGTGTPIWDVLFGTAYFPAPGEWPAVGLPDLAPPLTVGQFMGWSFGRTPPRRINESLGNSV